MPAKARKPKEPPPPGRFCRSKVAGVPARLVKTSKRSPCGRFWLYRLDYGNVVGTQEWTLDELMQSGVRFMQNKPRDWSKR